MNDDETCSSKINVTSEPSLRKQGLGLDEKLLVWNCFALVFCSSLRCGGGICPSVIWRPTFQSYVVPSTSSA